MTSNLDTKYFEKPSKIIRISKCIDFETSPSIFEVEKKNFETSTSIDFDTRNAEA